MITAASIVEYTVKEGEGDELNRCVQEYVVPAAREVAGYRGFLLFDRGENKRMAVLLFDSPQAVRAAQHQLTPVGEEHTYALMSSPAIGSLGMVVVSDGLGG